MLLWLIHGDVLWSASELDVSADGVKNLFTFAWHAEQSDNLITMDGMAAPFGEHFFYTDGHPLLSLLWRPIVRGFDLYGWSGPLISWLITLSWILTPVFLFKLLKHFGVSTVIAVVGSILIALLAPQIIRATGHYSMAYTVFIPLLWWWLIQYVELPRLKWFLLLTLLNIAALGTHAYLGLITTGFTLCYCSIPAFLPEKRTASLTGMLSAVVPLLLFITVLKLTDGHTCRIDDPGGYFEMRSNLAGVLLPQSGSFHRLTAHLGYGTHWEGWAYIGLAALSLLCITALPPVFNMLRTSPLSLRRLYPALFAALVLFGVACGQPFLLLGKETLDAVPYLQQFRGIGRLAWPLYFVLTLLAVLVLDALYRNLPRRFATVTVALFTGLWGYEIYAYHSELAYLRRGHPHPISVTPPEAVQAAAEAIRNSGADLIIPLPYFHIGSEFYGRTLLPEAELLTLSTAYHAQVPTSAALLTRTSLSETRDLLRLIALPDHQRDLSGHFQHTDTIALLKTHDQLRRDEAYWWDVATPLVDGELSVRLLPAAFLFGTKVPDACADSLIMRSSPEPYRFNAKDYHIIWASGVPEIWKGRRFELSWQFEALEDGCLEGRERLKPRVILQRRDGDKPTWLDYTYPEAASEHAEDGSWARPSLTFQLDSLPDVIECVVIAEQPPYEVTVSNLELREVTCP